MHNFPRMIEYWGGTTMRIRGSLVSLFESEVHSQPSRAKFTRNRGRVDTLTTTDGRPAISDSMIISAMESILPVRPMPAIFAVSPSGILHPLNTILRSLISFLNQSDFPSETDPKDHKVLRVCRIKAGEIVPNKSLGNPNYRFEFSQILIHTSAIIS